MTHDDILAVIGFGCVTLIVLAAMKYGYTLAVRPAQQSERRAQKAAIAAVPEQRRSA